MELQRKRKEKQKISYTKIKDCDFVIEEGKRYSGEVYGKQFVDEVCIQHPYHNHVLKIRTKDEISRDLEIALALEEIQRDYDNVAEVGDTYAIDNTLDSGFLSVKDTSVGEPDLLTIDSSSDENDEFANKTIVIADIEKVHLDSSWDSYDESLNPVLDADCEQTFEKVEEATSHTKHLSLDSYRDETESSNHVKNIVQDVKGNVDGIVKDDIIDRLNIVNSEQNKRLYNGQQLCTEERERNKIVNANQLVAHVVSSDKSANVPLENEVNNRSSDTQKFRYDGNNASRAKERRHSQELSDRNQRATSALSSNTIEILVESQARKQRKSSVSGSDTLELFIEPETIELREKRKKPYRYSSQISHASMYENTKRTAEKNDSVQSAAGPALSRAQSVASTSTTADSIADARSKYRRSRSTSFTNSIRSLKRSFSSIAASLRSFAGSLRSLTKNDDSLSSKNKTRSNSVKSLPALSEKRERRKFKRYSLDSLTSRNYDPRKTRLENEVADYERRNKVMQDFSKQADYMEKCFDMKDRKDEPYRGSLKQYRQCIKFCTKMDLDIQRQKKMTEEDCYKHIPYIDDN